MSIVEVHVGDAAGAVQPAIIPLSELRSSRFASLREAIGAAKVVLMGEETHGTQEFYKLRAEISQVLIEEDGFTAVLLEADFPAIYELNRYILGSHPVQRVKGVGTNEPAKTVEEAMSELRARFPVWMWRNEPMKEFVEWLRRTNMTRINGGKAPVMLLGLDIYSMFSSADEVIKYLTIADPGLAKIAIEMYSTLGSFRPEAANYCSAVYKGKISSQAPKVANVLCALNKKAMEFQQLPGNGDEFFSASENARVVSAAETYYRKSYMGGNVTWNIRDSAMVDMIEHTLKFQQAKLAAQEGESGSPRVIIWAHNSHVGDSAATEHHDRRQHNIGRLVRDQFGRESTFIVGFSTYTGTVRAARQWNGPDYIMDLQESLVASTGELFHHVAKKSGACEFGVITRTNSERGLSDKQKNARKTLLEHRIERFVGVQYIKKTERQSHYSYCSIADQFDFIIHVDTTSAIRPIPVEKKTVRPGIDYSRFENFDTSGSDNER